MWVFRRLFPESYSQQYRNKIGLIGLQDFGDGKSGVLKLCGGHAVARLRESSGDGVGDRTLHCCSLAVCCKWREVVTERSEVMTVI